MEFQTLVKWRQLSKRAMVYEYGGVNSNYVR